MSPCTLTPGHAGARGGLTRPIHDQQINMTRSGALRRGQDFGENLGKESTVCKYERMSPRMRKRTRTEGQDNARQPERLAEYECVARRSWRSGTRTGTNSTTSHAQTSARGAIGVSREGNTSLWREGGSNECPQRGSNGSNTSGKRLGQTTPNKSRS